MKKRFVWLFVIAAVAVLAAFFYPIAYAQAAGAHTFVARHIIGGCAAFVYAVAAFCAASALGHATINRIRARRRAVGGSFHKLMYAPLVH